MKKTSLLKIFCSVLSVVLLMSSCLGDGDSSFTIEKDFAYIVENNYGQRYAITSNGYIMHENITKLTAGNCYFIAYKIISGSADGYYNAEYVNVLNDGKAITKGLFQKPAENLETISPSSLSIQAWSWNNAIGDNWLIGYNLAKKERDEVKVFFYYDPDNQKYTDGTTVVEIDPVKDNKIIIDIRFVITDAVGGESVNESSYAVGNLSSLRAGIAEFRPNFSGVSTDYVNVPVKFRYQKKDVTEPQYIGNWQWDGSNAYYIQFTKN
ncbi:hypothetical protein [Dysgonomonas termitidis]|uniref:NigD-like protein n=1 Tax=Dysgonomonas termitidis TaxID=1516126 RepID=A0ABV9L1Q7_9BACT